MSKSSLHWQGPVRDVLHAYIPELNKLASSLAFPVAQCKADQYQHSNPSEPGR